MTRLAVTCLALLLGGCTVVPDRDGEAPAYRGGLERLTTWTATGRIHIQADEESWQATLVWRQQGDAYGIRLIAPLGQGTLGLRGDAAGVVLRTADGKEYAAAEPEALMLDILGWRVPVDGMRHWMVGRPDPRWEIRARVEDEAGRLVELRQAGWHIRYLDYGKDTGIALPRRIRLETERFSLHIVISRWEPGRA
ncbi:MAG: lipoprotein insertase outer membrane protein LolB [Gammaproteobacteria bacterium]|nr:lipoprotein insertase outer membrane protein LolB [Gammaproteobacteria bacterium]